MYVKFVKDDKTIEEVSISSEMIPFPTDTVVLEAGKFTVESREYDILDGTCTVILDQQITWQNILKSIMMQCLHTRSVGIIQLICHVKTFLR
jgi:hypothetical protein